MKGERRKSPRINQSLTVIPRPSKYPLKEHSCTKNISAGGMNLLTHEKMEPGEIVELGIYLPEFKRPLIIKGEVLEQREIEDEKFSYTTRIKFAKVNVGVRHQLLSHIQYCVLRV